MGQEISRTLTLSSISLQGVFGGQGHEITDALRDWFLEASMYMCTTLDCV